MNTHRSTGRIPLGAVTPVHQSDTKTSILKKPERGGKGRSHTIGGVLNTGLF